MIEFIVFLFGIAIGSFLLVLIERLPQNKPVLVDRSECDFCKKTLSWYELIPVVSYVLQGGKCRKCKKSLSVKYPLMEIGTGLSFVGLYGLSVRGFLEYSLVNSSQVLLFIFLAGIFSTLFVIFFTDLTHEIIPFAVVIVGVLLSLVYLGFSDVSVLFYHLLTAFITMGFFLSIFLLTKKRGIGFGDVVYGFYMGLLLGFPRIIVGLYLAFLTGAIVSIILVLLKKKKLRGDSIPFGPFLVIGTVLSIIFGNNLWSVFRVYLGI